MMSPDPTSISSRRRRLAIGYLLVLALVAAVWAASLAPRSPDRWILLGAVLAAALAVVNRFVGSTTGSLARVTAAAQAMAAGDLDKQVPPAEGDLRMLASALREIRERIRHRVGELEAEERDLRAVLDGLPDAVFLLDGGAVALANVAAGQMFREPSAGWTGADLQPVLPASLASALRSAPSGEALAIISEECGPDPSGRCLRATLLPLDETGRRSLVLVSDVTERATLDRVRRDFVTNASHELKTPAAAIQLLAESATVAAADGDSVQALAFVSQIAEEAARLRRTVLDLLDLSRLEGGPAAGRAMTDLRHSVDLAAIAHGRSVADRGLELRVKDTAPGQDLFAAADPTDVAVALDNLLDNALTYTESGGVTITLAATPDSLRVSVTDTGIGIPAEDIPRIFERFYRVDRARSRESGGTGLGLALVKHVVERSGGSVEVSSAMGEGSTFTLTLPRAGIQG